MEESEKDHKHFLGISFQYTELYAWLYLVIVCAHQEVRTASTPTAFIIVNCISSITYLTDFKDWLLLLNKNRYLSQIIFSPHKLYGQISIAWPEVQVQNQGRK